MQYGEMVHIMEDISYADRSIWESQRIVSLYIAQKNVTKKIELKKIFELPWDHEDDGEVVDNKAYFNMLKQIENSLNKTNENNLQQ